MSFSRTLRRPTAASPIDFVTHDHAALALHMARCARSRGLGFRLLGHLQASHSAVRGRLVTVAFAGAVLATTAALLLA